MPKWKCPIWDVKKTYQLVPKRDWPNREVAETYYLATKWNWLIQDFKRTYQVIPKKRGPIWDITRTYHRDLGFMKVISPLRWTIYFHTNRLWFFHIIILTGATLHNRCPRFARIIFLHMKTLWNIYMKIINLHSVAF